MYNTRIGRMDNYLELYIKKMESGGKFQNGQE